MAGATPTETVRYCGRRVYGLIDAQLTRRACTCFAATPVLVIRQGSARHQVAQVKQMSTCLS